VGWDAPILACDRLYDQAVYLVGLALGRQGRGRKASSRVVRQAASVGCSCDTRVGRGSGVPRDASVATPEAAFTITVDMSVVSTLPS